VQAASQTLTVIVEVKLVPVIVILVLDFPEEGETEETVNKSGLAIGDGAL